MTQKEKIKDLEHKLAMAKKHTYIHDTHTMWCDNGELHVGFNNDRWLVWNTDDLFKDLGSIVSMVTKENTEMQKWYLDKIKESLKEIKTK
tara:strand:+ start:244 stop:513 length:270 start_codon:yes stop_codon:yes gene_type:complete